jgi:hypothetical protein
MPIMYSGKTAPMSMPVKAIALLAVCSNDWFAITFE